MFITNFAKFEVHFVAFRSGRRSERQHCAPNNSGSAEPVRGPVVIRSPGLFVIGGSRRSPNVGIETVGDSRWPATHFYIDDRITIAGWETDGTVCSRRRTGRHRRQQVLDGRTALLRYRRITFSSEAGQGKCPEDSVVVEFPRTASCDSSRAVSAARRRIVQ